MIARLLACLLLLAAPSAALAQNTASGQPRNPPIGALIPPGPAATAGFNTLTFKMDSGDFTAAQVDTLAANTAGFKLYQNNCDIGVGTGANVQSFASSAANTTSLLVGRSGSTTGGGNNANLSTIVCQAGNSWNGVAFGGGFYIDIVASFPDWGANNTTNHDWPTLWTYTLEQATGNDVWPGQSAGTLLWNEIDLFEAYGNFFSNGLNVVSLTPNHAWGGVANATCERAGGIANGMCTIAVGTTHNNPFGLNANQHHYGALWLTSTQGGGTGSVTLYYDGAPLAQTTYSVFNSGTCLPPASGSNPPACVMGAMDFQHQYLVMGAPATGQQMTVYSIHVWQVNASGNLSQ